MHVTYFGKTSSRPPKMEAFFIYFNLQASKLNAVIQKERNSTQDQIFHFEFLNLIRKKNED